MDHQNWESVSTNLFNELKEGESLALSLEAEDSLFVRMTQAKVRQSTQVQQGFAELTYFKANRNMKVTVPFTFQLDEDSKACLEAMSHCRGMIMNLPEDTLIQLPLDYGHLRQEAKEKIDRLPLVDRCLSKVQGTDFVGILSCGEVVRANINSKGLTQWFETSTFSLDFSIYTNNQQAIKGLYGGRQWQDTEYEALITKKLGMLDHLKLPIRTLEKGKYRTYFSPHAVATLMDAVAGVASREGYQRGQSAFKKLVDGQQDLSPYLSLNENFTSGEIPRFNERGEISEELLTIVDKGDFRNLLCSSRSAKEYGFASNFANAQEYLRSPEILPGHLPSSQELQALGTGLYVSDLHYINWSNVQNGSITGMTRFGSFWVENGKIIAPVQDMRFDESLYHFWGKGLEGLTDKAETFPKVGTYFQRDLGSIRVPGMLVNDFSFVL